MQEFLAELVPSQMAVPQLQAQFSKFTEEVIPAIRNLENNAQKQALEPRPLTVDPSVTHNIQAEVCQQRVLTQAMATGGLRKTLDRLRTPYANWLRISGLPRVFLPLRTRLCINS